MKELFTWACARACTAWRIRPWPVPVASPTVGGTLARLFTAVPP